ncbi:BTB/POZ domain-containing protein KCTD6, partial [Stylophora pistillata]
SMLHAMFSGRFDTKPDEDGTFFIDRDGTHFRYILNYLRTGELVVPDDKTVRHELLIEAKFYQVEGIIDALTPKPFQGTVILSSDQRQTLINWLKDVTEVMNAKGKLLYRASRDGWNASHFHSYCDNKGPTVTVIKSGNYIFGGYSEQNWDGSSGYKRSPNSFLFSLVNPSGLLPTKMSLRAGQEGYSIWCNSGFGPIFGGGNFHDILIQSVPNSNNCSIALNNAYQCPSGQNGNTFLTGNQQFCVNELEVFGFEN